jgi:hypothetical protein
MIRADLRRAKAQWIRETPDRGTRRERRDADFLAVRDSAGRVADFHAAGRHTYITRLGRAGVSMKVAQGLARHSTITLTAGYTNMALADHTAALAALPALDAKPATERAAQVATGTDGKAEEPKQNIATTSPLDTSATRSAARGKRWQRPARAGSDRADLRWWPERRKLSQSRCFQPVPARRGMFRQECPAKDSNLQPSD